jgi:hypothetical protein
MKRPFPIRHKCTITRANVERVLAKHPEIDTHEKLADYFCGVGSQGKSLAKTRHIMRCWRLMQAPKKEAS